MYNQRNKLGKFLIYLRYFRIFINGSYCKYEICFGRIGSWGWVWYFNTKRKIFEARLQFSLKFLEKELEKAGY